MSVINYKLNENKKTVSSSSNSFKSVAPYLGLGTQLAVTVALLTLLGKYMDDQFLTKPLFFLIGAFLGAGTGLYHFIKSVLLLNQKK